MSSNLFWIDLEMTGLDVEKEVIIEVAVIVTDYKLNELETYHTVIKQPQSFIDAMDDWNKKTHKESGLVDQIPKGKYPVETVAMMEKIVVEAEHHIDAIHLNTL